MTALAKILAGGLIATLGNPLVRVWEWLTDDPRVRVGEPDGWG